MLLNDTPGFSSLDARGNQGYLVAAMYTPAYTDKAARLAASLRSLGLAHALFEVPQVHRSISTSGSDDPAFAKPAFIRALLDRYQQPVVYVDADVVFRAPPVRLASIAAAGRDFAIYNWLADEHTDAFQVITESPGTPPPPFHEAVYLGFSHGIFQFGTEQLICSGLTQLYGNTSGARALLDAWARVISAHPGSADDHCLDFAFNNDLAGCRLATVWLDKAYARIPWWIYVRPIIDHPDTPSVGTHWKPLRETSQLARFHPGRLEMRKGPSFIPHDCIIDVRRRLLLRFQPATAGSAPQLLPVGRLELELFLTRP